MRMTEPSYMTQQVDAIVRSVAARYGLRLVSGLLLEVSGQSVHLDYILMDRHGFLILAADPMPGQAITGSSDDAQWKARADGAKAERFDNPLKQNRRSISLLKEALVVTGRRFADEYFTDLVVFGGADISGLKLNGVERLKVVDARDLEATIQARYDFSPNPGLIEQHEIDDLTSLFKALDRSDSRGPHAVEAAPARVGPLAALRRPKVSTVAVADHVAGLAPSAPRLSGERYPDSTSGKRRGAVFAGALPLVLILALGVWLFGFGGYGAVVSQVLALWPAPTATAPQPAPTQGATIPTEEAVSRFRKMQPQIYALVDSPDSPTVQTADGVSKFTWTYVISNENSPHTYTLGFNTAGRVVYVDSD